ILHVVHQCLTSASRRFAARRLRLDCDSIHLGNRLTPKSAKPHTILTNNAIFHVAYETVNAPIAQTYVPCIYTDNRQGSPLRQSIIKTDLPQVALLGYLAFSMFLAFMIATMEPSRATIARGVLPSTCPKGITWNDGCLNANPNAAFQTSSFFTCTASSHCGLAPDQSPYVAIPRWNVAGISYPVGNDKTLTYKDP